MLWICLALLAIAGIAAFVIGDAGSLAGWDGDTIAAVTASLALLIFVGSSIIPSYSGRVAGALRDFAIWLGLALVLVVGYSFREEAQLIVHRVSSELAPPGQPISVRSGHEGRSAVRIRQRSDGHFAARASVNGAGVTLLVDTGASTVLLKPSDARAAGFDPDQLAYTTRVSTANGETVAAAVRIDVMEIGSIRVRDIEALVAKPGLVRESLLGMSFLARLRSYEFSREFLTLRSWGE
ncbi:MAG: retropepsin-like aspartic protease family protein [Hyphomicrobiaceae bacterium]